MNSKPLFFSFLLLTFGVYFWLDVLTASCFHDSGLALFWLILLVGQLTLICVWGTLVEGAFWFRLPWTLLLMVISWAALCVGAHVGNGKIDSAQIMGIGMVWFYGFAISYVPLKIAALAFGWKIRVLNKDIANNEMGRYAIRDIMIGTTILACTLAIGRQFVPGQLPPWSDVLSASHLDEPMSLLIFLVFSIISLIVKLPCIWIALAATKSQVLTLSMIWVFSAGLLGFVEVGILIVLFGAPSAEWTKLTLNLVLGHAVMAATMIGVLYCLRCFGYRMIRKRSFA